MTHLSLFSGIGGLDLAAEWAGFETVGQCEWAEYPRKVLEKHWPDVPKWKDIHDLTGRDFYEQTGLRTVDVISGGFPCQPFSVAGRQVGANDERYLWPEMLRVIRELRPRWVVGENVDGLLSKRFDETLTEICAGLASEGYEGRIFSYEAAQMGAWHRRRRTFIVAHAESCGLPREPRRRAGEKLAHGCMEMAKRFMADTNCARCEKSNNSTIKCKENGFYRWRNYPSWAGGAWSGENDIWPDPAIENRLNHDFVGWLMGFPYGWAHEIRAKEQIRAYGNAVAPQQAYPIFETIARIEGAA